MAVTLLVHNPEKELGVFESLDALKNCSEQDTIWLDIEADDAEQMKVAAEHFGLHELAIEDCLTPGHFPKIDNYDRYVFLIFRGLKPNAEVEQIWESIVKDDRNLIPDAPLDDDDDELFTRKVAVFFSHKFIITFRRREIPWLDAVIRQVQQYPERTISGGTDVLVHRVLDVLIDRTDRGLSFFEQIIDGMEDQAVQHSDEMDVSVLLKLKRDLSSLRQIMREQRVVINKLVSDTPLINDNQQRRYFRDIEDHTVTIIKSLDKNIDSLQAVRDTYFAAVNIRLGDTMRVLAIITTIAAPLNIVVGFYGMNFDALPMLHNQDGVWLITVFMFVLTVIMLVLFKKKQWI